MRYGEFCPKIAVRSVDLEFLPIASGEDFDFGPDRAFVVGQPFQIQAQPVVLVAAFVSQQDSRTVILRDEQICSAVAIVVASDDGARIFELNLVEADVGGDILETIWPKVAEQTHFAFAILCFADGGDVDPAIVVVVDGSHAEGTHPVCLGQFHAVEALAVIVVPECQCQDRETC